MLPLSLHSIFYINLSSYIHAKVAAFCDIATLHTPTAILLSHLQALYNNNNILTFVIAISLFSGRRGRRGRYCNSTTAHTGGGQRYRKRQSQRGCWPRRRLHCYTKVESRDRGLVAERCSFKSLTNVNYGLCEAKS